MLGGWYPNPNTMLRGTSPETQGQKIYQQKKKLRIPEVIDQQDFSNCSVLESLTLSLEVMQWKEAVRSRNEKRETKF